MITTGLSITTLNALANVDAFKKAYDKARKAAICGAIEDVLGYEWTAKQFNAYNWQRHDIEMPSLDALFEQGWISRRSEEFELPMHVKERIAGRNVAITFEDGTTVIEDAWYERAYRIGESLPYHGYSKHGAITKFERAPLPEFKGHRYIYRLA